MIYFFPGKEVKFENHPKFSGVKWFPMIDKNKTDRVSVCYLLIEPGVEIPVHIHDPEIDSILVLEGEAEIYMNGGWHKVEAGDYLFVPAKEEHGVKNIGKTPLKLFIVHSPPLY
ncbi:Cupin 2 conserved barrel domain protein [Thermodesulfatator indicus DSM 15286]|uniref:Cupin 2 conserved barrel domain protein n=1 Tax=Thermodesulfatator indicus (strain DSM 15286 / JCM 11887 / CIR29812) TaxID=667014 RepID=F8ADJ5_THEID|nr:cupin domain-containing protein [Thermodesulfatator indicus]AEH44869.1 Cupin 2 conserved barrel domain protein [Thermodesulfatator indicus DSM 15286]